MGEGSLQLFVHADFEQHYFTLREDPAHHERLKQICLFDLLANNADRKSGHCLLGHDGQIYAIDNALTLNAEPKLRTVIWDFSGQPIPEGMLADLRRAFISGVPASLATLLDSDEQTALLGRVREVVKKAKFPKDASGLR